MAKKYRVYYEIGSSMESLEFDDVEAEHCYYMICDRAATFEEEGGDETTVTLEEIEDDE